MIWNLAFWLVILIVFSVGFSAGTLFGAWWATRDWEDDDDVS